MTEKNIVKSLLKIQESLTNLSDKCDKQFEILSTKVGTIEDNFEKMQGIMNKLDNCGMNIPNSSGIMPNFSKIDNKEEYLNNNVQNVIQCDVLAHLRNESKKQITYQHVYDILKRSYTIYEFAAMIIQGIVSEGPHCLYAFPFQKHVIYHWNHEKITWEKISTNNLKQIFNIIQQQLVMTYNGLIKQLQQENKFHLKSAVFMENGGLIFADDFDKKYKDFKKILFDKLCN